jgi:hypothetical protein
MSVRELRALVRDEYIRELDQAWVDALDYLIIRQRFLRWHGGAASPHTAWFSIHVFIPTHASLLKARVIVRIQPDHSSYTYFTLA